MAGVTGTQLIYSALRDLAILRAGQTASPELLADGLQALSDLIDSWSIQRLFIPAVLPVTLTLVPGQQAYKIGPGAPDFNVARPQTIEEAGIITTNAGANGPLRNDLNMMTLDDWSSKPIKNVGSTIPTDIYYDGYSPVGTLYLWPFPSAAAQLELYYWQALPAWPTLATSVTLPAGYSLAIRKSLAVLMIPMVAPHLKLTRPALDDLRAAAIEAVARVKAANKPSIDLKCDLGVIGSADKHWNWLTGD